MRKSTKTWACSLPLVLAVAAGLGGCIKRQPLPEPTPGEVTATTPDKPVATRKSAPTEATGKWGQVQGTDSRGNAQVVTAMVPLANMFGYINTLRSMSQGRAQYSMQFDHYEQVPQAIADEVKAKYA